MTDPICAPRSSGQNHGVGATSHQRSAPNAPTSRLIAATVQATATTAPFISCLLALSNNLAQAGAITRGALLRSYLPAIVFLVVGGAIGALFASANALLGPKGR